MLQTQAREKLEDADYTSRLTMDGFYRLLIKAGYPKDIAHEATKERSWNRLLAGEKI